MAVPLMDGALDPTISTSLRLLLAAIFFRAIFGKLRDPHSFARALRGYELVPSALAGSMAALLLALECLLVPALILPFFAATAAIVAGGVLCLYTLAIGINLVRGRRDIDCGCAGPSARQPLHETLLMRNFVYIGVAAGAALPLTERSFVWLDFATVPFAVASLFALAIAFDGLAALAARTPSRRPHA